MDLVIHMGVHNFKRLDIHMNCRGLGDLGIGNNRIIVNDVAAGLHLPLVIGFQRIVKHKQIAGRLLLRRR